MSKLRRLKANVAPLGPRLGFLAPGDEKDRDRVRRATQPWRAWYNTRRWKDLAQAVFVRDLYTCQRSGILCISKSPAPDSPVAHHKVPHQGDPHLFWDIDNIQTVSKAEHDGPIQQEERASGARSGGPRW
jgi:5-methylcytosine-specific restriction endonuclease McrA